MATVQIATLFCLTLLYSTQACDIVGSNIDLSATCYNNGSVVYAWQYVSEAQRLGNAKISYTCTTQQGNTSDVQRLWNSVGVTTLTVPSWNTGSSCVFEGCYVYSKASEGYPTLAIPAATCSSGPILTSQPAPTLTSQPAPTLTSQLSLASTHTTSYSLQNMSSSSTNGTPSPTTTASGADNLVIFVPVVVVGVFVLIVFLVTLPLVHTFYWKHQGSYQVDKDKINNYIANQPYDHSLPEPEGFIVPQEVLQQPPSLYSFLLTDQPLHTEVHSESEQEEMVSNGGEYVACDLSLVEDIVEHLNTAPYTGSYTENCISPTFSDRSGYVDFCPP